MGLLLSDGTQLLGWLYLAGFVVMLLYFAVQIVFLQLLRGQHEHVGTEEYEDVFDYKKVDIYQIPASHAPFSFGRCIRYKFVGDYGDLTFVCHERTAKTSSARIRR
ncbi:MAG: hypothetical protein IJP46_06160 [Prevotella sp.]|nr:hypothetical protein [Prevotella sp.]